MEKDTNKKMLSLEISNDLREALRVEAFHKNVTISALIRQILEKELKLDKKSKADKVAK
jgi:hypothetical protein